MPHKHIDIIYTHVYIYIYNHKLLEQSTQTAPLAESESIPSPGKLRTLAETLEFIFSLLILGFVELPCEFGGEARDVVFSY